jgi:hypothetical protein
MAMILSRQRNQCVKTFKHVAEENSDWTGTAMTGRRVFRAECFRELRVQRPNGILKESREKDNIAVCAAMLSLWPFGGYLVFSSILPISDRFNRRTGKIP